MIPFYTTIAVALSWSMLLSLYRTIKGPSAFDRLTGLNMLSTKMVVLLVVLGFLTDRVDMFVDIAISYALMGFIGVLVLAKYFETGKGIRE